MSVTDDNYKIIDCTMKEFGRIDILVNNNGGPAVGKYNSFSDEDWTEYFHSVLLYNIRMTREVVKIMESNNWGRIINVASLSVKEPAASLVVSNVFRAGVIAFAKSISKELIKSNITINNICPGAFLTERARDIIKIRAIDTGKSVSEIEENNVKYFPQGRYQKCSEFGALVAFLCSEDASSLTGTTIQLDGGISNGLF